MLSLHVLQSLDANELACLPGLALVLSTAVTGGSAAWTLRCLKKAFIAIARGVTSSEAMKSGSASQKCQLL